MFFQWFVAPEGRKVGSLKRRVRSQLAKWEMKNCTPLWHRHISKLKYIKHTSAGLLLEVEMSKKCTPLRQEKHFEIKMRKHFEVKMLKILGVRTTFGGLDVASLHFSTLHYTTLHYTTLHYTTLQLQLHNYTPLHSTTLNYITLH